MSIQTLWQFPNGVVVEFTKNSTIDKNAQVFVLNLSAIGSFLHSGYFPSQSDGSG